MDENICFVGDLFVGGTLLHDRSDDLIHASTFRNADVRIANLEHAIGSRDPISKKSTLHGPPEAVEHLVEMDIDAVSIANNHIHDLGTEGIEETIETLQSTGIDCFGAGRTIQEASEPYWVNDELAIFGYCAYNAPSLTKIQVATDDTPGVNPLTRRKIRDDLQDLDLEARAILFVHWGIENTLIPPTEVVELAEELLNHPRVAGIVGSHPHRVQGYTSCGSKRAYFSVGNFLFPNFHLEPPASVSNARPDTDPAYETKRYHPVTELTKKKWTATSRISLLVTYDSRRQAFDHIPLYHTTGDLSVRELTGRKERIVRRWVSLSKCIAEGPHILNQIALSANHSVFKVWNILGILLFLYRQNGAQWLFNFLSVALRSKLDPNVDANDRLYEFFAD